MPEFPVHLQDKFTVAPLHAGGGRQKAARRIKDSFILPLGAAPALSSETELEHHHEENRSHHQAAQV
jgi:hypothetical protein